MTKEKQVTLKMDARCAAAAGSMEDFIQNYLT